MGVLRSVLAQASSGDVSTRGAGSAVRRVVAVFSSSLQLPPRSKKSVVIVLLKERAGGVGYFSSSNENESLLCLVPLKLSRRTSAA